MKSMKAKGFTLVELIVVIVILGILSAVAIPKFTGATKSAYQGVQDATTAALKSAWSVAYGLNKGTPPTLAQLGAQMQDPTCSTEGDGTTALSATSTTISCTNVTKDDGTGSAVWTVTLTNGGIASPSTITLTTR